MPNRENYVITICDAANRHETRPVNIRLRALFKLMLRGFGLRCIDIRPTGAIQDNNGGNDLGYLSATDDSSERRSMRLAK